MVGTINVHIHNNIQVSTLKIRQSAENCNQAAQSKGLDKENLTQVIATLNQLVANRKIPVELEGLITPQLHAVESQLALPKPKKTILKKGLQTIKMALESTASNLFIHEIILKISSLLAK